MPLLFLKEKSPLAVPKIHNGLVTPHGVGRCQPKADRGDGRRQRRRAILTATPRQHKLRSSFSLRKSSPLRCDSSSPKSLPGFSGSPKKLLHRPLDALRWRCQKNLRFLPFTVQSLCPQKAPLLCRKAPFSEARRLCRPCNDLCRPFQFPCP